MSDSVQRPATRLGGYRLVRPLGSGGAAVVWEAVDEAGDRYALKLLHPAVASDQVARVRLAREAQTLNRVRSAAVAHVVDLETEGQQPFVVTELVDGLSLRDEVRQRGPFYYDDAVDLAFSLAEVLRQVHAAGVIHRDLKPSNVMLGPEGPVLIDFGISRAAGDERLTSTGLVTGTPGWVAPEVLQGADDDEVTDWWGAAAIVLFSLTGRQPFGTGKMEVVLGRIATGRPDTRGVYPPLATVLRRALGPRQDRLEYGEFLDQLREFDAIEVEAYSDADEADPQAQATQTFEPDVDSDSSTRAYDPEAVQDSDATRAYAAPDSYDQGSNATRVYDPEAVSEGDKTRVYDPEAASGSDATRVYAPKVSPEDPPASPIAGRGQPPAPQWPVAQRTPGPQAGGMPGPQAGGVPGPQAGQIGEASVPQWAFPSVYQYRAPGRANLFSVGLMGLACLLPVWFGMPGAIWLLVLLVFLEAVGNARTWRERRRTRVGSKQKGDNALAALRAVPYALKSVFAVGVNALIGGVLAGAAWSIWAMSRRLDLVNTPFLQMLQGSPGQRGWLSAWQDVQAVPALLWVSVVVIVLLCHMGAGGWHLREGERATISAAVPSGALRLFFGIILCGVCALTVGMVTGVIGW
ncbi:protein kinase [Gleimia hominis]|uniref:non-specific serine/threonine protein kinase n=1 Tax=Gleimia hominis TaxID=595468 RepID=A0ABU3I7V1_9ACTO|nr:protein kinase [Gleimia hominis]MDT3766466.1 protein kinase [Gleimia hominis]